MIVSVMICRAGAEIGYDALRELSDTSVNAQVVERLQGTIADVDGVRGVRHCRQVMNPHATLTLTTLPSLIQPLHEECGTAGKCDEPSCNPHS